MRRPPRSPLFPSTPPCRSLLAPGETASPGSPTGKTGAPSAQTAGTAFNVTVNAVDANWNVVSSTDTVHLASTRANAPLNANPTLVADTHIFFITIKTAPSQTMPPSDLPNGAHRPFLFNDTATTESSTLSLHDALPI